MVHGSHTDGQNSPIPHTLFSPAILHPIRFLYSIIGLPASVGRHEQVPGLPMEYGFIGSLRDFATALS
ncbi:Uncharacterized protein HZ326_8427 [Fusarium oxysporum f. sp. albedinis]|nr:Uncharacterized protein HZ326_8427 [Fusarium oxysporum f. sp. albedinis]